ncbi:hypothetical protein IE53DRAFT_386141 [Violaceomyces palustris]|uniref:Uncharacterized protein n=1 Tax=Violaceomyces palustris TaxID=1673888 RepID=A0ACD0P0C7_9BASI|nr:hypothetical protein IE53DRAFT_386141 [Violaceomyces palustris]
MAKGTLAKRMETLRMLKILEKMPPEAKSLLLSIPKSIMICQAIAKYWALKDIPMVVVLVYQYINSTADSPKKTKMTGLYERGHSKQWYPRLSVPSGKRERARTPSTLLLTNPLGEITEFYHKK